jgi:hypothetical protein
MARITFSSATIGGKMVAEGVDHIRKGRECLERAVALANSISAGGATPALLESSVEFNVAVGQGAEFYTAVNGMKVSAATVTDSAIADIDMGED